MKQATPPKGRQAPNPLYQAIDAAIASRVAASPHTCLSERIREMRGDATAAQVRASVNRLATQQRVGP